MSLHLGHEVELDATVRRTVFNVVTIIDVAGINGQRADTIACSTMTESMLSLRERMVRQCSIRSRTGSWLTNEVFSIIITNLGSRISGAGILDLGVRMYSFQSSAFARTWHPQSTKLLCPFSVRYLSEDLCDVLDVRWN